MSNELQFWRTYGDEGSGCSLSLPVPYSRLQKIQYGPEGIKQAEKEIVSVLDLLDSLFEIADKSIQKKIRLKLAETFWGAIERIRYLHKHGAYKYENECRVVVAESDVFEKSEIRFENEGKKASPGKIRHFFEDNDLQVKNLLITGSSITLGPCMGEPKSNSYNMKYYLKKLMNDAGLGDGPKIMQSKIPYRKS